MQVLVMSNRQAHQAQANPRAPQAHPVPQAHQLMALQLIMRYLRPVC